METALIKVDIEKIIVVQFLKRDFYFTKNAPDQMVSVLFKTIICSLKNDLFIESTCSHFFEETSDFSFAFEYSKMFFAHCQ